jgi:DNA-directed RNA polymerase alpha subunit
MKITLDIENKRQLDAVYFAYENPVRILNLIGMDFTEWDFEPIESLPLTVRSYNVLMASGIKTIGHLTKMTTQDLYGLTNMGRKSVEEIAEVLNNKGLSLKQSK